MKRRRSPKHLNNHFFGFIYSFDVEKYKPCKNPENLHLNTLSSKLHTETHARVNSGYYYCYYYYYYYYYFYPFKKEIGLLSHKYIEGNWTIYTY